MKSNDSARLDALTNAFNHLLKSQDVLEQRIARIENALQLKSVEIEPPPAPLPLAAEAEAPEEVAEPVVAQSTQEPLAESETVAVPETTGSSLESKVGLTLVNRIGAITLVLGIAFFFKWAVDNNWIGPAGRVILGLLAGFLTLGAGDFLWRKRQQVFAQGITATGTAIIYLALYAAFNFYHLIPQSATFLLMVSATAMAAVLALRYKSIAIAALSLAAAYLTPLLLSTGQDHPWFLFSYLLLLNFAATELAKRGGWPNLEFISFAATVLIYGAWLIDRGSQPAKQLVAAVAALAFTAQRWRTQILPLFAISEFLAAIALTQIWPHFNLAFLLLSLVLALAGLAFGRIRQAAIANIAAFSGFWISHGTYSYRIDGLNLPSIGMTCGFLLFVAWAWYLLVQRRETPSTLVLSTFALNGVFYYALAYSELHANHHVLLGPLAVLVAAVYLGFGIFLHREAAAAESTPDTRPVLLALGIALAFLTLAIPIQFTGFTITIAWAIQGALLTWIAARFQSKRMIFGALFILVLVAGRLLLFETEALPDPAAYSLLWNSRFFTFAVSAIAMLLAAFWTQKILQPAALGAYLAGNIFLLWGLCLEIAGWAGRSTAPENRLSVETIAISILFGLYAVILVSIGVGTRAVIHRLSGLGLIGIVILKLYFFDVWQLSRPFQIAAFVVLGILLLSTSFLYSHFRRLIETWWKDEKTAA